MKFEVTILGSNSAFPAQGRFPSAQVLNHHEELFLIDCGEGAQIRMSQFGIKRMRIRHILISHLHGDHVFGLPGLINSYQHLHRTEALHIYAPSGIRQMLETVLRLSKSVIDFDLVFHELQVSDKQKILETKHMKIYAFPLRHRIPTFGFLFVEKPSAPNIRKDAIAEYNLSIEQIKALKAERSVPLQDGTWLSPSAVLEEPSPARSYAYCSDTIFDKDIIPWIEDVTLLYHEATFLHALEHKALESMHSTALQAGTIAHLANAGRLLLGHFSSRYEDLEPLLEEAKAIFQDTGIAEEGKTYQV